MGVLETLSNAWHDLKRYVSSSPTPRGPIGDANKKKNDAWEEGTGDRPFPESAPNPSSTPGTGDVSMAADEEGDEPTYGGSGGTPTYKRKKTA